MKYKRALINLIDNALQILNELKDCKDEFSLGQKNAICDMLQSSKCDPLIKKYNLDDLETRFNIQ